MFSSRLLTALAEKLSAKLGRNLERKAEFNIHDLIIITGRGGHSGGETPEPIPNSEDKPARVGHCTQMRELSGNAHRCHGLHDYYFIL
jgi:hypothetical protein